MALIDCFMLINNEEELVRYALESFASLGDILGIVSLVDNNSTDASLAIVDSFKDRLKLVIQHETGHSHHGQLRNMAMQPCTADWIFYLDSDETFTSNFGTWLRSGQLNDSKCWQIFKYTTILDKYHYVEGGNGPTQRLFRNLPGRSFPQSIHTEPTHPEFGGWSTVPGVYMFDATACKSVEALRAKGERYQWAFRENVPAIGPAHEYTGRVEDALINKPERNVEFAEEIRRIIFTGPEPLPGHPGIPWNKLGE